MRYLCETLDNKRILYDPVHSHTATHFNDAPGLKDLVVQLLSHRYIDGGPLGFDVDMGNPVGNKDVVDVNQGDEIVYAKRKNRAEYVSFIKNRQPQPCSYVSISLKQLDPTSYELQSTWIGEFESPPFPGDKSATRESIPFWNRHAFVWGTQGIQEDTITNQCPW